MDFFNIKKNCFEYVSDMNKKKMQKAGNTPNHLK